MGQPWGNYRSKTEKCNVVHPAITIRTKMEKKTSFKSQNSRKILAYTWTQDSPSRRPVNKCSVK